ncbi:Nucleotidyl transferase domain protein [Acididesulfobacillus acetoxydans]|uniref:Nucleoside-diphosphate-sugar pyrophosphorylase fused to phosphomannomutase n=1 Tax=Acididesulfobacillus acetoxydans TaxID=1561005 RepID=A0A8S0WLX7_9FIRM|nr:nucleotidyltransferase family protein [Acididesulfobacillus acetoxydans]CAA7600234.1 Nucleotidyl transferase domain protein [Acididesulfobacillus acetoxydans]CEJ09612.1 Nucleoside-diphosphate-sugar pyrophosphorylase fused to phosphomannomutase [Acididesulfobacillus acetoxydans]
MKTLILAAGKGTRLRPLTAYVPKPMLPLQGKPLLEWVLLPLIAAGMRDFVLAVSYLAEQIVNYFGDGARWGVTISYSRGPEPAGKAGEIWRARELLHSGDDPFLLVPGDTIAHLDYRELLDFHRSHGGPVTVAFSRRYRLEVGTAELDEKNRVTRFREKANLDQPVSTGAYVLDERILSQIEALQPEGREVDLPAEVFPRLLAQGTPIYGYVGDYSWWDVGRMNDYEKLTGLSPAQAGEILGGGGRDGHLQSL